MPILPTYRHIIKPKLKHIYLSFDERGTLIIKSPHVSQKTIETLLIQKASWIQTSQKKIASKKGKTPQFVKHDVLYYLGEPYPLKLIPHTKKTTKLTFDHHTFNLHYYHYNEALFLKHIDAFYKSQAMSYLPPYVDKWAHMMQLSYTQLSVRKTKRQWGSCSSTNTLGFNSMIMKLPPDVIQYIIVHELAHIRHKHHQKAFWDCVAYYLPDYKVQTNTLKHFTT